MASWVSLLAALAVAAAAAAQGARFGDRLAPRVPAPYAPRASPPANPLLQYEVLDWGGHEESDGETDSGDFEGSSIDRAIQKSEDEESGETTRKNPSRTEAHRLEMSTEYFVVPEIAPLPPAPLPPPQQPSSLPAVVVPTVRSLSPPRPAPPVPPAPPAGPLRSEPWAVPVLALACSAMLVLAAFEGFIIWGARRSLPSRRHLLLGQTLLLGLFSCAVVAALFAASPSTFICGVIRFGTGASYALVFASLLVKCVFLLSVNGGVYLPAAYQALLLLFAVLIQLAIGTQWLGSSPPQTLNGRCGAPLTDLLLSLVYVAFLILLVAGVALRSRSIRDNYRESTHIAAAAGASALLWICWISAALAAPERHKDAAVAAGLLATCVIVFSLMFASKGRRLVAIGKEGRYEADRDEGLSSLGRAGSGYSPSFFHFKPVKYGIVTGAPAAVVPVVPPPDHKESPSQPADRYAAMGFSNSSHFYARSLHAHPPQYYPSHAHHLSSYHYQYTPYHYFVPPGTVVRTDDGNVYTTVEPTFSTNPNVYFHRTSHDQSHGGGVHPGMMY